MKLVIISNDLTLKEQFLESTIFSSVELSQKFDHDLKADVIVISDRLINHTELTEMDVANKTIFYMLTNDQYESNHLIQNIKVVCETYQIKVVPPKRTSAQVVEFVLTTLFPDNSENKKIVVFFGADTKVGTTMIAQSVAEKIAAGMKGKVGFLIINNRPNDQFFKSNDDAGIDDIRLKVFNGILDKNELLQTCVSDENLYILRGPTSIFDLRYYNLEHVEYIIDLASKVFDLVIIDAGSEIDSAFAVGSLLASQHKYLVTTQQESAKDEFIRKESQTFNRMGIHTSDFLLVANKFVDSGYTKKQLEEIYRMTFAVKIPFVDDVVGWQAEIDRKTLLHYGHDAFNEGVQTLSHIIAKQMNLELIEEKKQRNNLLRKIRDVLRYGN